MKKPIIAIIILNANRHFDTLECLTSVFNNTYDNFQVLLLNLDTDEDSTKKIQTSFPEVEIISISENRGYTGNNNIGLKNPIARSAEWILLLNEDTILDHNFLHFLLDAGESDERIGIVGPMVYHYNEPNKIQSAGGLLGLYWEPIHIAQNELDVGQISSSRFVDWVSGCAVFIRRDVIDQVGLLDERFFCYWEEVDWCLRAHRRNWKTVHTPLAKIWHKGVQGDYKPRPYVTYYMTRNQLLLYRTHHAPLRAWTNFVLITIRTLTTWSLKPKWWSMKEHRAAMWRGIVDFLRHQWGPLSTEFP